MPSLHFIVLLLLAQCLGQEVEHVENAEVVDHDQMGEHGDHQDMVMSHDQGEEDSGMVMMGSSSMLIRPPPIQMGVQNEHPHQQQSDESRMGSKEQFCLAQMTKCLANPQPLQNPETPPQQQVQASGQQEVIVDPPASGQFQNYEPMASGVNVGKITRMKKKPHSLNMEMPPGSARCSSQNFIRMHECCSNGPAEFFSGAILYACADIFPLNPSIVLKEYNLNLGQLPDNTLDLSRYDTTSAEVLGNGVCFVDCLFKKRFLISEEGMIDYTMAAHHFMSTAQSRPWQPVLMQAIRNCSQIMYKFPTKMMNAEYSFQRYCHTHPYLFLQCVRKSLLMNCAEPNQRTESAECVDKRNNLQRCDIFQKRITIPRY